jgi:hypothetical protein
MTVDTLDPDASVGVLEGLFVGELTAIGDDNGTATGAV